MEKQSTTFNAIILTRAEVLFKITIFLCFIALAWTGIWFIPISSSKQTISEAYIDGNEYHAVMHYYYNLYGDCCWIEKGRSYFEDYLKPGNIFLYPNGRIPIIILIVLTFFLIYWLYFAYNARCFNLSLTENGIRIYKKELIGGNEDFFAYKDIVNITQMHDISRLFWSGERIDIIGQSKYTKIQCVQNAEEFIREVNLKLEKNETFLPQSNPVNPENMRLENSQKPTIDSSPQNNCVTNVSEKMMQLKNLYDKGVISKEEYELKRKKYFDEL